MAEQIQAAPLCRDQRRRWEQGEPVSVEAYLEQHPDLAAARDIVLDLIYNEMILREQAGQAPQLAEYIQRFPQFEAELRPLFEVHRVVVARSSSMLTSVHDLHGLSVPGGGEGDATGGTAIVPGYQVLAELGRGGMGVVYKARQLALKRLVALKMILSGAHASARELARFRTEAEAVARLQHPNIVQIYDIGEQNGRPYFSLELADAGSLQQQLAGTPQPPQSSAQLVEVLARAMHYAHQRDIVHRDLKPSNVLLVHSDRPGAIELGTSPQARGRFEPKITDFGLAKLLDSVTDATPTDAWLGTPNYMAPEQAAGKSRDIGPAADVYSLGAILYELLTGRPPFRGPTVLDTLEQVRSQEPVAPARLQPKVPRDLETICLKCLDKEPHRRYASAEDLAEDLRRFQVGDPIRARPVSVWRRCAKWAKRRPAATALALLTTGLVLSLVIAGVWMSLARSRHRAQLREDVQELMRAGQAAFAARDWPNAKYQLATALDRMGGEPSLADLRVQAEGLQTETMRQLEQQARTERADRIHRDFLQQQDVALLHGMGSLSQQPLFTGMDSQADRQTAAEAAQAALGLVGLIPGQPGPWAPSPGFNETQRADITTGCYTLLLVLADAIAQQPVPGEVPRQRFQKALALVDQAAQIGPTTRASYQRRAAYLGELGDTAAAKRARDKAEATAPAGALDHLLIGEAQYKKGNLPQASRAFERALVEQPRYFWAHLYLARCALDGRDWERGRDRLSFCILQRPEVVWLYLLRGLAERELGSHDDAAADFRRAEDLLGPAGNPHARYVLYINRGNLWYTQQKLVEAAADFRKAIDLNPAESIAYLNLARVRSNQGREAEWDHLLRQALQLNPPRLILADFHVTRANELYLNGKYAEAVAACESALKEHPDYVIAEKVVAQALLKLQRHPEAVQAYTRYLEHGGEPLADIYRGRGIARMQRKDFLGARDDYTRALELQPNAAEVYLHRGWAYFFLDAWKPALHDFERAIQLDSESGDAYTGQGLARVMLGDYRAAVADADKALRREPSTPEMMHNLACVFAQASGRVQADAAEPERKSLEAKYRERAVQAIQRTLSLVPSGERARFWRDKILPDSALDPIRSSTEFQRIAREYSPASPSR